jgi:tetratricopeptide (TPR) repeat protein
MTDLYNRMLIALSASIVLAACTFQMKTPEKAGSEHSGGQAGQQESGAVEKYNPEQDEVICKEALKAWRRALVHDETYNLPPDTYKLVRRRDEDEAMLMLVTLADRYPEASYIRTMMGQVKQHFGRKKEAKAYYEEATLLNRRNPSLYVKTAEDRRKSGDNKRALAYFRMAIKLKPDFTPARIGVARCLLAGAGSAAEGRKMLEEILSKDPQNADAQAALNESGAK